MENTVRVKTIAYSEAERVVPNGHLELTFGETFSGKVLCIELPKNDNKQFIMLSELKAMITAYEDILESK